MRPRAHRHAARGASSDCRHPTRHEPASTGRGHERRATAAVNPDHGLTHIIAAEIRIEAPRRPRITPTPSGPLVRPTRRAFTCRSQVQRLVRRPLRAARGWTRRARRPSTGALSVANAPSISQRHWHADDSNLPGRARLSARAAPRDDRHIVGVIALHLERLPAGGDRKRFVILEIVSHPLEADLP